MIWAPIFVFLSLPLQSNPAARFEGGEVSMRELDEHLAWKYGKREEGEGARQHLRQRSLVEREASRRGVAVAEETVALKMAEIERGLGKDGFEKELREKQMTRAEFSSLLRISLAQERMTREDLGLRPEEALSAEQTQLWIAERQKKAGEIEEPSRETLGQTLRALLGRKGTKNALLDLVGIRVVENRAREAQLALQPEEIDAELTRRRAKITADPRYQGVSFEELLKTQGMTVEDLRESAGLRASMLLERLVRLSWPVERLQAAYEKDKARYDGQFGESRRVSWILIRGGEKPQGVVRRSLEDAQREAEAMRGRIASLEDFQRLAKIYSEDEKSKERAGELGFLHRREAGFEESLLDAVAQAKPNTLTGPVKLRTGVALLWVGETKAAPKLEEVYEKILDEKRSAYFSEMMQGAKVTTFLD